VGQRANFVLVEGREYRLFYSHWCANTLPRDLFWGPEHAVVFIRIQRAVDDSGWLDEVWAEGGALLDLDQKQFLLYGGEDVLYDVPLRRIYFEMLGQVWKGWTVRWAHEGIADLADYVGYPRDRVLTKKDQDSTDVTLTPPEQKDWTDLVGSVRFDDVTVRFYPLAGDVAFYLSRGSKLVNNLRPADGVSQLLLDEWKIEFPSGGFHLDLPAQRLEFWVARDAPDIQNRVETAWPGWETRWHHDHYERQLERTEGLLRFPFPDRQALLDRCREMLLRGQVNSAVDTIQMLTDREREQGKEVHVNTWALRDDRLDLPQEERKAILDNIRSHL
jgi:hypothetical protein